MVRDFLLTSSSTRRFDNKFNIFEGLWRNWLFIAISLIMIGGQILIIFIGGRAFSVEPLSLVQWAYSVILGVLSIPFGAIIRLIPDGLWNRVIWVFKWASCGLARRTRQ
jgi:Ca2+-transporting ATPase